MNNAKVQDVGQKLVDPQEKLRCESAEREKEQAKSDNAVPKVATTVAESISKTSGWENGSDGTQATKSRNFPGTSIPVHEHAKNTGSEIPAPSKFESDINHDPRERKSGAKQRVR